LYFRWGVRVCRDLIDDGHQKGTVYGFWAKVVLSVEERKRMREKNDGEDEDTLSERELAIIVRLKY
jgi:hypothetical protein